jgi:hypothetical protein
MQPFPVTRGERGRKVGRKGKKIIFSFFFKQREREREKIKKRAKGRE